MQNNFRDFFGLSDNFTNLELKNAYLDRINRLKGWDMSEKERNVYLSEVDRLYFRGIKYLEEKEREEKFVQQREQYLNNPLSLYHPFQTIDYLWNNMFMNDYHQTRNHIHSRLNNLFQKFKGEGTSFSESRVYRERSNPDGTTTVMETHRTDKDGKVDEKTNTYRKSRDGRVSSISYEEAMKSFEDEIKNIQ